MATRNKRLTLSFLWLCAVPCYKMVYGHKVEVCETQCSLFSDEGGHWKSSSVPACPQVSTSRAEHTSKVDDLAGWLRQFTRKVQPHMGQFAVKELQDLITASPGGLTITVDGGTGRWHMTTQKSGNIWLISVSEELSWLHEKWQGVRHWVGISWLERPPLPLPLPLPSPSPWPPPLPVARLLPCQLMSKRDGRWHISAVEICPQPSVASSQLVAEVDNLPGWLQHLSKRIQPHFGELALQKLHNAITARPQGLITTIEGIKNRRHLMTRKSGDIWQAVYLPED